MNKRQSTFDGEDAILVDYQMAVRLARAFGASTPEVSLGMQAHYDLWQIEKRKRIKVELLPHLQHS